MAGVDGQSVTLPTELHANDRFRAPALRYWALAAVVPAQLLRVAVPLAQCALLEKILYRARVVRALPVVLEVLLLSVLSIFTHGGQSSFSRLTCSGSRSPMFPTIRPAGRCRIILSHLELRTGTSSPVSCMSSMAAKNSWTSPVHSSNMNAGTDVNIATMTSAVLKYWW